MAAQRTSEPTKHVVVLDDDPHTGTALTNILRLDGHQTTVFQDGRKALAHMRHDPPDLLLLDLRMPPPDGLTVLRELRADEALTELPVVLITGSYDDDDLATALQLGVVDLICKPFHRTETRLRINAQLRVIAESRRTRLAKQALLAVQQELQLLHMAVEQSPASVVITNTRGEIEYVNRKFCELTGYTVEEVRGNNPRVLKSGSTPSTTYAELWNTITTGGVWSGQFCNRRKDGTEYWEQVSISPVRGTDGSPTHFIALKEDITARRALEVQLRQSQKLEAVGQLAAGIAHEINTPSQFVSDSVHFLDEALADTLTLVSKYREVIDRLPLDEAARAELEEAERAADLPYLREHAPRAIEMSLEGLGRITRIVQAMKEFSHTDQGEKRQADLNAAIRNTLVIAANELKYVAEVECRYGEIPPVSCLISEMNQVFLILVVNAAHAIAEVVGDSGQKGRIYVSTRACEGGVEVTVRDTGAGIPETVRHRIFEPFFTTKPVGKGTGQGLAIARTIVVNKHGGRLTFESERSGQARGTTFTVWLPLEAGDAEAIA